MRGDPGGGDSDQGEDQQASDHCLPPARGSLASAVAGVQEVPFGLAERRVARGVGVHPGDGFGGGRQQGAGVEVGRVAGVACPVGRGGLQPGADDPVGVGIGQPGVAQQRPGGHQYLVADLDTVGGQGEQPFGGEGLQDRLHVLDLGRGLAVGQPRPGGPVGGVQAVAAGGGQPGEDLPGGGLLSGGETVVGALRAAGDGAFDPAGTFIVGQGEGGPGPAAPRLVQGVRQQGQHPGGGGAGLAGAHLGEQDLGQVVVDFGARLLGRLGDRQPQLPLGHRGDQVAVLDRAGQLRVLRAPGLEIGPDAQDHQGRRCVIRAMPGGGGRVQRGDERPPLLLVGALGEQLLELVGHQQQPALPRRVPLGRRAFRVLARPARPGEGGLARGKGEPLRRGVQSLPHRRGVQSRQQRHP